MLYFQYQRFVASQTDERHVLRVQFKYPATNAPDGMPCKSIFQVLRLWVDSVPVNGNMAEAELVAVH